MVLTSNVMIKNSSTTNHKIIIITTEGLIMHGGEQFYALYEYCAKYGYSGFFFISVITSVMSFGSNDFK